jgi:hypothetical protein
MNVAISRRFALLCFASPRLTPFDLAALRSVAVSYLVVRLDVQLDLFAGQGADSAGGKDWSA